MTPEEVAQEVIERHPQGFDWDRYEANDTECVTCGFVDLDYPGHLASLVVAALRKRYLMVAVPPVVLQVAPRDWPKVIWYRLRYCMRSGHEYGFDDSTYCTTCGAPWRKAA